MSGDNGRDDEQEISQAVEKGIANVGDITGPVNLTSQVTKYFQFGSSLSYAIGGGFALIALVLGVALFRDTPAEEVLDADPIVATPIPATPPPTSVEAVSADDATASAPDTGAAEEAQETLGLTAAEEPQLERLGGEFNVAVLQFAAPDDDEFAIAEADDASIELVQFLERELAGDPRLGDVRVGYYERTLVQDMGEFARSVNATIVVTAHLGLNDRGRSVFTPVFIVQSEQFDRAGELAGEHALGSEREFRGTFESPAVRRQLRTTVQDRSEVLVQLIVGLGHYKEQQYPAAVEAFENIVGEPQCLADPSTINRSQTTVESTAYVFLGNASILESYDAPTRSDILDRAERCFLLSLAHDPDAYRPRLGLSEVTFQRSTDLCSTTPEDGDRPQIQAELGSAEAQYTDSLAYYLEGLEEPGARPVPFLESKARLGLGRILLCSSQLGRSHWDDANQRFDSVLEPYLVAVDEAKQDLEPFASEAYAGLAFVRYLRPLGLAGPNYADYDDDELYQAAVVEWSEGYEAAIALARAEAQEAALADLSRAVALSDDDERAAFFVAFRATIREAQGDAAGVVEDCALAAELSSSDAICPAPDSQLYFAPPDEVLVLAITGTEADAAVLGGVMIGLGSALVVVARRRERRFSD